MDGTWVKAESREIETEETETAFTGDVDQKMQQVRIPDTVFDARAPAKVLLTVLQVSWHLW